MLEALRNEEIRPVPISSFEQQTLALLQESRYELLCGLRGTVDRKVGEPPRLWLVQSAPVVAPAITDAHGRRLPVRVRGSRSEGVHIDDLSAAYHKAQVLAEVFLWMADRAAQKATTRGLESRQLVKILLERRHNIGRDFPRAFDGRRARTRAELQSFRFRSREDHGATRQHHRSRTGRQDD